MPGARASSPTRPRATRACASAPRWWSLPATRWCRRDSRLRSSSGGGTSTAALDVAAGTFNELQAGSYVFVDRGDATGAALAPSLFVSTAVISTNQPGRVTLDAGGKAVGAAALVARGAPAAASYALAGVEHGFLVLPEGAAPPAAGARVELFTPHIDPTVNLYDVMYCVRGETLVDIWPIDARGRH